MLLSVLIVHPVLTAGGAESIVIHLARYLDRHGTDFAIAVLSTDTPALPDDVRRFRILQPADEVPYRVRSYRLGSTLAVAEETRLLRRLVRREGKDYTVLNPHNFPAMWSCSLDDRPCLWQCNEPPDLWSNPSAAPPIRWLTRAAKPFDAILVRRYATEIVAVAEWTREQVRERYGRDSVVVNPGVDYEFFRGADARRAPWPVETSETFTLLEVGSFAPQKNQLAAVRAVESLVAGGMRDVRLVFVGNDAGPYGDAVRAYVRSNHLEPFVRLLGPQDSGSVRDAYAGADAVVFPTLPQSLGLAPLEGVCAGTPCIVSPEAGVARVIRAIGGGIVSEDLAEGVRFLRTHFDEVAAGLAQAQARIRAEFDWEAYGARVLGLLEGLAR